MSELSQHAKLIKAIEIAKGAQVGIELSYFDVLEVAGELNEAKEVVAMLNARIAELEYQLEDWTNNGWAEDYKARIAGLEEENDRLQAAWFEDETICPDGSLKPKVSTLLENRFADTEACNGRLVEQVEQLTAENKRLKAVLNEWDMAWLNDCIAPQPNGNEAFGLDEGLVLCARMMKPILEETRLLLGKAEVVR